MQGRRMLVPAFAAIAALGSWVLLSPQVPADTRHPATASPDQVVVTFSGDPQRELGFSWRTAPAVTSGELVLRAKGSPEERVIPATFEVLDAATALAVPNDPVVHRFSVTATGLEPDTDYEYSVRTGADSETELPWEQVRTAPSPEKPFTFMYLGDSQNGLEEWSRNYQETIDRHPEVRFMVLAGDLVDHGEQRAQYDAFFGGARRAFARVPFVPVLGNHDHIGNGAALYTRQFVLPAGGPVKPEHCYAFEYGSALMVVLDSTSGHALDEQARWLDGVLQASSSPWKFVSFHHPVWSSVAKRDNLAVREAFAPVIEKHGVAMVLNGHDHAYARTVPLRGDRPADDGTVYVVTVSGKKMYPQDHRPVFKAGMTDTATYQLITVSTKSIVYSARTWDGVEVDHYERKKR